MSTCGPATAARLQALELTARRVVRDGAGAPSDKKAYQLQGVMEYHSADPIFDGRQKWDPPQHPGRAAAAPAAQEADSGAERLSA